MSDHPHTPNTTDGADRRVTVNRIKVSLARRGLLQHQLMPWWSPDTDSMVYPMDDPETIREAFLFCAEMEVRAKEAADEIERLSAVVAAVDAKHHADDYGNWCCGCEWMWPCPTHLAIHPEDNR